MLQSLAVYAPWFLLFVGIVFGTFGVIRLYSRSNTIHECPECRHVLPSQRLRYHSALARDNQACRTSFIVTRHEIVLPPSSESSRQ